MKAKGRVEGTVHGCFVSGPPARPEFYCFSVLVFWWGPFQCFGDFWEPVGLRALKLGTHTHARLIGMHTPPEHAGHLTKKRLTDFSDYEAHQIIGLRCPTLFNFIRLTRNEFSDDSSFHESSDDPSERPLAQPPPSHW